jgi:hypothetical protein
MPLSEEAADASTHVRGFPDGWLLWASGRQEYSVDSRLIRGDSDSEPVQLRGHPSMPHRAEQRRGVGGHWNTRVGGFGASRFFGPSQQSASAAPSENIHQSLPRRYRRAGALALPSPSGVSEWGGNSSRLECNNRNRTVFRWTRLLGQSRTTGGARITGADSTAALQLHGCSFWRTRYAVSRMQLPVQHPATVRQARHELKKRQADSVRQCMTFLLLKIPPSWDLACTI